MGWLDIRKKLEFALDGESWSVEIDIEQRLVRNDDFSALGGEEGFLLTGTESRDDWVDVVTAWLDFEAVAVVLAEATGALFALAFEVDNDSGIVEFVVVGTAFEGDFTADVDKGKSELWEGGD